MAFRSGKHISLATPFAIAVVLLLSFKPTIPQTTPQNAFSKITVYILPPASSTIFVNCWTNNSRAAPPGSGNYTFAGEIGWRIPDSYFTYYDVFWCRARTNNFILTQFSVYGDGTERSSSEWVINSAGRRRISLNGQYANDSHSNWITGT